MEKKFEFKPFDKVLVKSKNGCPEVWSCDMFSHYEKVEEDGDWVALLGYSDLAESLEVIPFEGNEHLLGTSDPYEPPYEPKVGDFVRIEGSGETIVGIYKGDWYNLYVSSEHLYNECGYNSTIYDIHPATEEEKQLLLDKMHEAGKDWDAEKMEIVDYEWKPKKDEVYYAPVYGDMGFHPSKYHNYYEPNLKDVYAKGWVFKTEEECQALCDKLNEAIKNIK